MNLKQETQRNLLAVFGLHLFEKAVIFFGLIVLTRLLRPEDFGILAIAEILITVIGIWNEHVFEAASIATPKDELFAKTVDTAFLAKFCTSLFLYILLFLAAGPWADFYNDHSIAAVIRVLGLSIVIPDLYFVQYTTLVKERKFDSIVIPMMLRAVAFYALAIFMARAGMGLWSIVISRVVSHVVAAVSFFIIKPRMIRFTWDREIFNVIFRYIRGMYLLLFFYVLITQVDRMVIGKLLGVGVVGYYAVASNFGNWVTNNILAVSDRVSFPLYAQFQDNGTLLKSMYLKFLKYIMLVSVPFFTCLFVFARPFILVFLGSRWEGAVIPLRILCLAGFFGMIGSISNSFLKGVNRLDIEIKRNSALCILLILLIVPLTLLYGLTGGCIAVLLSFAFTQPLYFYYSSRIIEIDIRAVMRTCGIFFGASMVAVLFYLVCRQAFMGAVRPGPYDFFLSVFTYGSAYAAIVLSFMRKEFMEDIRSFVLK
ncbi:MAG: oligosaccharide flippase family protein [Candidatus Omnitrophota bacterium]